MKEEPISIVHILGSVLLLSMCIIKEESINIIAYVLQWLVKVAKPPLAKQHLDVHPENQSFKFRTHSSVCPELAKPPLAKQHLDVHPENHFQSQDT